jgi:hypothetical protein
MQGVLSDATVLLDTLLAAACWCMCELQALRTRRLPSSRSSSASTLTTTSERRQLKRGWRVWRGACVYYGSCLDVLECVDVARPAEWHVCAQAAAVKQHLIWEPGMQGATCHLSAWVLCGCCSVLSLTHAHSSSSAGTRKRTLLLLARSHATLSCLRLCADSASGLL